ncbi:Ubiquitin thioesterase OTU1 [Geodia barretti]|nr:Ubiquitin thioesterase OTU1 [Geodia barretti]
MGLCYSSLLSQAQPKLARRIVPADNSCLFRSISYLITNDTDSPSELRQLAAGIILSNPHRYSSVVLGKERQEYVEWLLRDESWGGAIELSVLSEHYKVELDVVDIQSQRIDRFGEGAGFRDRALLIYDGIHYDPLVMEGVGGAGGQRMFPVSDARILEKASQLAREAFQARQYTDVAKFSLKCLACGTGLQGQSEAQRHAMETGHINFGEV